MDDRRRRELAGDIDTHEGEPLTPSEEKVMRLSARGVPRDAISYLLHIGHSTLHKHLLSAFAKLAPGRGRAGAFFEYGRRSRADKDRDGD